MITHPPCPADAPNSCPITGTTTFTIELFKTVTKTAEIRTSNKSRVETRPSPPSPEAALS